MRTVNRNNVHVEGKLNEILNDYANATLSVYKMFVYDFDLSKTTGEELLIMAVAAAIEEEDKQNEKDTDAV